MKFPVLSAAKRRMVPSALSTAAAALAAFLIPSFAQAADCSTVTGYGACSIQFCMDWPDSSSTCRAAWYTVSGTRYSCTSCTSLTSCVQAAANRCAALAQTGTGTPRPTGSTTTGGTSTGGTSSSGSSSNSCRYANDGECDEGSLCSAGTDSSDCRGSSSSGSGSSSSGSSSSGSSSSSSSGSNSCRFSYDDVCDEGSGVCASGTDTYDCTHEDDEDELGCSLAKTSNKRSGALDLGLPLVFGALLFRQRRRRNR